MQEVMLPRPQGLLTVAQWGKVLPLLKSGAKELVIHKDESTGSAFVVVYGTDGVACKCLKGNVIQFPIKMTPRKSKAIDLWNRFVRMSEKLGLEICLTLGVVEDFSEEEDDGQ